MQGEIQALFKEKIGTWETGIYHNVPMIFIMEVDIIIGMSRYNPTDSKEAITSQANILAQKVQFKGESVTAISIAE